MNRQFTVVSVMLSAIALFLPTRSQTFTRVAVEGRAMRMLVSGSGESTVVFENGLGAPLEMWGKVQPHVSRFAQNRDLRSRWHRAVGRWAVTSRRPADRQGTASSRFVRRACRRRMCWWAPHLAVSTSESLPERTRRM